MIPTLRFWCGLVTANGRIKNLDKHGTTDGCRCRAYSHDSAFPSILAYFRLFMSLLNSPQSLAFVVGPGSWLLLRTTHPCLNNDLCPGQDITSSLSLLTSSCVQFYHRIRSLFQGSRPLFSLLGLSQISLLWTGGRIGSAEELWKLCKVFCNICCKNEILSLYLKSKIMTSTSWPVLQIQGWDLFVSMFTDANISTLLISCKYFANIF